MDVRLSVEGRDADQGFEELSDWIDREPELRGLVKPEQPVPQEGELGATAAVLVAAVGSGGALSVLLSSLKAFLALPRRSDVRIVIHTPDGARVEVDAKRVRDVESLVRTLTGDAG